MRNLRGNSSPQRIRLGHNFSAQSGRWTSLCAQNCGRDYRRLFYRDRFIARDQERGYVGGMLPPSVNRRLWSQPDLMDFVDHMDMDPS
jgi:hypothetical protein